MCQIIDQIGLHCENFVSLSVAAQPFDFGISSAIVSNLANIKSLVLKHVVLGKEDIMMLLLGCEELELLYIQNCPFLDFKEFDVEMLQLASRVKDFKCEDCRSIKFTLPQFDEEEMLMRLAEGED